MLKSGHVFILESTLCWLLSCHHSSCISGDSCWCNATIFDMQIHHVYVMKTFILYSYSMWLGDTHYQTCCSAHTIRSRCPYIAVEFTLSLNLWCCDHRKQRLLRRNWTGARSMRTSLSPLRQPGLSPLQ